MEIAEIIKKAFQEWVVPELSAIRSEISEVKGRLEWTNERLTDLHTQLADQSRRIDETNKRIDEVRTELTERIESVRTELTERIESVRSDLTARHDQLNLRMDELGRAIVRRDEYDRTLRHMEHRLTSMEHDINDLKRRVA